jgi:phenylacetyl-CoA:acceptor oxidoreductase subunit 1
MTRYVMTIDLRRCVGCQTCTAACKGANATPPGIQWRRVLDIESGEFPDVRRTFLPVACMHCGDPPCESVCPTRATTKRADGLVAIDYDLCIGCANCVMACPYDARSIVHEPRYRLRRYADGLRSQALRSGAYRRLDEMQLLQGSHRPRRTHRVWSPASTPK